MVVCKKKYSILFIFVIFVSILSSAEAKDKCSCDCYFKHAPPVMNFGVYDTKDLGNEDAVATLYYRCSCGKQDITVRMSSGSSGVCSRRHMSNMNNKLSYNIYRNPAHVLVWGDGQMCGQPAVVAGTKEEQSIPIYGRLTPMQDVDPNVYKDTLAVVCEYSDFL